MTISPAGYKVRDLDVYRYPVDDPMTAEPLPAKSEVERDLDRAEAFVEAVAHRVVSTPPSRGGTL